MARLLNLDEVADALGVSRRTVEREVARGALSSQKVRGARRVSEAALAAYIERVTMSAQNSCRHPPRPFRVVGRLGEGPDPLASSN